MELRMGEVMVGQCAGGICIVCKNKILPGPAVYVTKWSNKIRHLECLPKVSHRTGTGNCIGRRDHFFKLTSGEE